MFQQAPESEEKGEVELEEVEVDVQDLKETWRRVDGLTEKSLLSPLWFLPSTHG